MAYASVDDLDTVDEVLKGCGDAAVEVVSMRVDVMVRACVVEVVEGAEWWRMGLWCWCT